MMVGAMFNPVTIGANAATIGLALGAFYKFITRALGTMIDERVHPALNVVTAALTDHMAAETTERKKIARGLKADRKKAKTIAEALDGRADALDEIGRKLDEHMVHDDQTLAAAATALNTGQEALLSHLDAQHAQSVSLHEELSETVKAHVRSDEAAFNRIESKLPKEK